MTRAGLAPGAALAAVLAVGLTAAVAGPAHAQIAAAAKPAFSIERFTPAPGGGTFLGVEEADVLPAGHWSVTLSTWLMNRPIVLRDLDTGAEATVPVRWRWGQELGVARGLGSRYQVGLAVPTAAQWGDRLRGIGLSEVPLRHLVLGDLRVHGRVRITGRPGAPGLAAALAGALVLPTGHDGQFAGEEGWMAAWGVRVGWRGDNLELGGGAGIRVRTEEVVLLSPARPHGNELSLSAAAAVRVPYLGRELGGPDRVWALGEIEGVIGDSPGAGKRGPSPAEARIGLRAQVAHCWSVAVAAGGGLTPDQLGSPSWRAVVQVRFDQAPHRDLDGDGVPDVRDACWRQPEDRDGVDDWDGCPDPDDDGDGIPDVDDACPLAPEDHDGYRDADGCPDREDRFPGAAGRVDPGD